MESCRLAALWTVFVYPYPNADGHCCWFKAEQPCNGWKRPFLEQQLLSSRLLGRLRAESVWGRCWQCVALWIAYSMGRWGKKKEVHWQTSCLGVGLGFSGLLDKWLQPECLPLGFGSYVGSPRCKAFFSVQQGPPGPSGLPGGNGFRGPPVSFSHLPNISQLQKSEVCFCFLTLCWKHDARGTASSTSARWQCYPLYQFVRVTLVNQCSALMCRCLQTDLLPTMSNSKRAVSVTRRDICPHWHVLSAPSIRSCWAERGRLEGAHSVGAYNHFGCPQLHWRCTEPVEAGM